MKYDIDTYPKRSQNEARFEAGDTCSNPSFLAIWAMLWIIIVYCLTIWGYIQTRFWRFTSKTIGDFLNNDTSETYMWEVQDLENHSNHHFQPSSQPWGSQPWRRHARVTRLSNQKPKDHLSRVGYPRGSRPTGGCTRGDRKSPRPGVMGPLPNGRTSWHINGGPDPKYLLSGVVLQVVIPLARL